MRPPSRSPFGRKAPVEEGKIYRVKIEDLSHTGGGIAKIQGFVIFVEDTIPGEEVDVKILRVSERSAVGRVVKKA